MITLVRNTYHRIVFREGHCFYNDKWSKTYIPTSAQILVYNGRFRVCTNIGLSYNDVVGVRV